MKKSWKTTTAAVAAIVAAIAAAVQAQWDGDASTVPDWSGVVPTLIAAVGLLFARDNDKRSEDVGAGKAK
jgi:hypothetical protein